MNSTIFECKTYHQRIVPKKHHFSYRYFIFLLDLDEIDELDQKLRFFSKEKFNLFNFKQTDHNLKGQENLLKSLEFQLQKITPEIKIKKVYLLTSLRTLGHLFNPVSFYFIETDCGQKLIAEVMNTFHEFKNFIVEKKDEQKGFQATLEKNFYISPYSKPMGEIKFNVHWPQESLNILIQNLSQGDLTVSANLMGKRLEFSDRHLLKMFFKYPLVTMKVVLAIHFQALLLFLKRVPFVKKTDHTEFQTETDLWKTQKK